MGGRENFKQKKNKRSSKVPSTMEGVYSETQYMGERGGFGKCKRSCS